MIEPTDKRTIIKRMAPPNKYDQHPFGTECIVVVNDAIKDRYVQNSKDESEPNWQLILEKE
jgi:hypothetical protein